jgi:hypothetical protein
MLLRLHSEISEYYVVPGLVIVVDDVDAAEARDLCLDLVLWPPPLPPSLFGGAAGARRRFVN